MDIQLLGYGFKIKYKSGSQNRVADLENDLLDNCISGIWGVGIGWKNYGQDQKLRGIIQDCIKSPQISASLQTNGW